MCVNSYFFAFVNMFSYCFTNVGRDLLNILWGLLVLLSHPYPRKLMIMGGLLGYILNKLILLYFDNSVIKYPVAIIGYYCMMRILNYYNKNVLAQVEDDPLIHGSDIEITRVKKALSYLSVTDRYSYLETPENVEFFVDWKNYREEQLYKSAQEQYDSDWESEYSGDEKEEEELVECDECGKKDIDPSDLSEGDCNLSMCGKGYAHEGCMSEELKEAYNNSLNDTEDYITDDELEEINDTIAEVEKEESIKRGWFNWTKSTKSKIV